MSQIASVLKQRALDTFRTQKSTLRARIGQRMSVILWPVWPKTHALHSVADSANRAFIFTDSVAKKIHPISVGLGLTAAVNQPGY